MPLRGIRILDLSRLLPGPYATQLLRDLGATVTKIENLETGGDPLRHYAPRCADGNSAMFHALNRGKHSVALPFRSDTSAGKIRSLLSDADVLVESFRPGTFEKLLGISSAEELLRAFPRLVLVRLSGYGSGDGGGDSGGSSRGMAGHDLNFAATAGLLDMAAVRGAPLPVQFADLAGGAWPAALQIVAALYRRDAAPPAACAADSAQEGGGSAAARAEGDGRSDDQWRERLVDVKMVAGAHSGLALPLARRAQSGERVGGGRDFLTGNYAAYAVYHTLCGGHLAIAALEPHFWSA